MQSRHRRMWVVLIFCILGLALLLSTWLVGPTSPTYATTIVTTTTTRGSNSPVNSSKPTTDETGSPWQHFKENRSLALIHIGKAGGLSLRAMTSLKCRLPRDQVTDASIQRCLFDTFGSNDTSTLPLVLQTTYYAHMNSIPHKELDQSTSWLVSLRDPVDRVISAYRYSHPANCQDVELKENSTKGCTNRHILHQNPLTSRAKRPGQMKMEQQLRRLFVDCFPEGNVERFVQTADGFQEVNTDDSSASNSCSYLARAYITGKGPIFPIPHLRYNYRHYWKKALEPHDVPGKEWFGVRTEYLWEDFQALNIQIGGEATRSQGATESDFMSPIRLTHGSETFRPYSLSLKSYQQLCCMLHDEILVYLRIVKRLWNLSYAQKRQTVQDLTRKCGTPMRAIDAQLGKGPSGWQAGGSIWEWPTNTTCPF